MSESSKGIDSKEVSVETEREVSGKMGGRQRSLTEQNYSGGPTSATLHPKDISESGAKSENSSRRGSSVLGPSKAETERLEGLSAAANAMVDNSSLSQVNISRRNSERLSEGSECILCAHGWHNETDPADYHPTSPFITRKKNSLSTAEDNNSVQIVRRGSSPYASESVLADQGYTPRKRFSDPDKYQGLPADGHGMTEFVPMGVLGENSVDLEVPSAISGRVSSIVQETPLNLVCKSWWNPTFKSRDLEARYRGLYYNQHRRRGVFVAALVVLILGMGAWTLFNIFGSAFTSKGRRVYAIASGVEMGVLVCILLFSLTRRYYQYWLEISLLTSLSYSATLLACLIGAPDSDPSNLMGLFVVYFFLIYTLIPMPILYSGIIAGSVSVLSPVILAIFVDNRNDLGEQIVSNILIYICVNIFGLYYAFFVERFGRKGFLKTRELIRCHNRVGLENDISERLILSMLPKSMAAVLDVIETGRPARSTFRNMAMQRANNVTILFADIVGFTALASKLEAEELVNMLNNVFTRFDRLAEVHDLTKIKTLGDCYFLCGGIPEPMLNNAEHVMDMGLGMVLQMKEFREESGYNVDIRVGIHTGSVLAGMIGLKKFHYDAWSQDVTIAAALEASGVPGKIHVSEETIRYCEGEADYDIIPRFTSDKPLFGLRTYIVLKKVTEEGTSRAKQLYQGEYVSTTALTKEDLMSSPAVPGMKRIDSIFNFSKSTANYLFDSSRNNSLSHFSRENSIVAGSSTPPRSPKGERTASASQVFARNRTSGPSEVKKVSTSSSVLGNQVEKIGTPSGSLTSSEHEPPLEPFDADFTATTGRKKGKKFSKRGTGGQSAFDTLLQQRTDTEEGKYDADFIMDGIELGLQWKQQEIEREMSDKLNILLLKFDDPELESAYQEEYVVRCVGKFSLNVVIAAMNYILITAVHLISLEQTVNSGIRFASIMGGLGVVFVIMSAKIWPEYIKYFKAHQDVWVIRLSRYLASSTFYHLCAISSLLMLLLGSFLTIIDCPKDSDTVADNGDCPFPKYIAAGVYVVILNCTNFVRLRSLYMTLIAICCAVIFNAVVFSTYENLSPDTNVETLIDMVMLVFAVGIINWQMEINVRMNFLMKRTLREDLREVANLKERTDLLLTNILPMHVSRRLLSDPGKTIADKYASAAVIFCNICNWSEFYTEDKGIESMTVLNEIICEFDELCDKPKYSVVEKIKTIGSTYMAAAGLKRVSSSGNSSFTPVHSLADFALELIKVLDAMNKDCFTNFTLRIGMNVGPAVAGVIGNKKFAFDIWGDAVNVASRMESSGVAGKIQVTRNAYKMLKGFYVFEKRGPVYVKGKGDMMTYFLIRKKGPEDKFGDIPEQFSLNEAKLKSPLNENTEDEVDASDDSSSVSSGGLRMETKTTNKATEEEANS
eukprot:Nk52_evm135s226 gene=Nk52_evmTU135s226